MIKFKNYIIIILEIYAVSILYEVFLIFFELFFMLKCSFEQKPYKFNDVHKDY